MNDEVFVSITGAGDGTFEPIGDDGTLTEEDFRDSIDGWFGNSDVACSHKMFVEELSQWSRAFVFDCLGPSFSGPPMMYRNVAALGALIPLQILFIGGVVATWRILFNAPSACLLCETNDMQTALYFLGRLPLESSAG